MIMMNMMNMMNIIQFFSIFARVFHGNIKKNIQIIIISFFIYVRYDKYYNITLIPFL